MTTTDQLTAARGKEPLRTLATYRRDATDPTDPTNRVTVRVKSSMPKRGRLGILALLYT